MKLATVGCCSLHATVPDCVPKGYVASSTKINDIVYIIHVKPSSEMAGVGPSCISEWLVRLLKPGTSDKPHISSIPCRDVKEVGRTRRTDGHTGRRTND